MSTKLKPLYALCSNSDYNYHVTESVQFNDTFVDEKSISRTIERDSGFQFFYRCVHA